jgi:1-acyl-sn-glycerol-3-phosphate acyltransferase
MSADLSVQAYIEMQPRLAWRRHILRWLIRNIPFSWLKLTVTGQENPGLLMGAVTNRFVIPMTKIENTHHFFGALAVWWWGSYTINRGEVDRKALMNSIELLKSGQIILISPEGTRSHNGLQRPKDGMAYIATKANAVIIPVGISGAIGWKEKWTRFQRPEIHIHFGRAFRFKTDGRERIPRDELSAMTDEAMYQLAQAIDDEHLRGEYADLSKASARHIEFI